MIKIVIPVIFILILSSGIIPFSSCFFAEELRLDVSAAEDKPQGEAPPITRNPFINAPYGRMPKPLGKSESSNPEMITKRDEGISQGADKGEDTSRKLKVKGVILGGNSPMALLGHRIVKTGDKIDDFIVIDINHTGVSLSKGNKVIQLSFER